MKISNYTFEQIMLCCRLSTLYLLYYASATADFFVTISSLGFFFLFFFVLLFFSSYFGTSWNSFRFCLSFACPQKHLNDLAFQYFYLIYDIVLYWYLDTKLGFIDAHVLFCKYWYKCTCILSLEKTCFAHDPWLL